MQSVKPLRQLTLNKIEGILLPLERVINGYIQINQILSNLSEDIETIKRNACIDIPYLPRVNLTKMVREFIANSSGVSNKDMVLFIHDRRGLFSSYSETRRRIYPILAELCKTQAVFVKDDIYYKKETVVS